MQPLTKVIWLSRTKIQTPKSPLYSCRLRNPTSKSQSPPLSRQQKSSKPNVKPKNERKNWKLPWKLALRSLRSAWLTLTCSRTWRLSNRRCRLTESSSWSSSSKSNGKGSYWRAASDKRKKWWWSRGTIRVCRKRSTICESLYKSSASSISKPKVR